MTHKRSNIHKTAQTFGFLIMDMLGQTIMYVFEYISKKLNKDQKDPAGFINNDTA